MLKFIEMVNGIYFYLRNWFRLSSTHPQQAIVREVKTQHFHESHCVLFDSLKIIKINTPLVELSPLLQLICRD